MYCREKGFIWEEKVVNNNKTTSMCIIFFRASMSTPPFTGKKTFKHRLKGKSVIKYYVDCYYLGEPEPPYIIIILHLYSQEI